MTIEVEAQPVPQMTTKSHENHAESGQGETTAAKRDGAQQGNCQRTKKGESSGTVRERKRASPADSRRTDRDLGAPSPATVPTIPYRSRDTGGEILGEEHKEKTDEQRSPQRRTRCGLLSGPSDSEVLEERREREQTRRVSLDPSTIRKDGTDEGSQGVVLRGHRSRLAGAGEEGGQGGFGDPLTVGLILVQQRRGEDEKEARCGDHHWLEVLDIDVEVQGRPAGLHSRTKPRGQDEKEPLLGPLLSHPRQTMARSLCICPRRAGPAQRRDKEDKRTGSQTEGGAGGGRGNYGAETFPAGALAHVPCCHTKEGSIRVGLKDGGKRERFFFFVVKENYCISQCSWLREVVMVYARRQCFASPTATWI